MAGFDIRILSETFIIVVSVTVINVEVVVPLLYNADVRAGVMIDVLTGTVIAGVRDISVGVLARVDSSMRAPTMTTLAPMLSST